MINNFLRVARIVFLLIPALLVGCEGSHRPDIPRLSGDRHLNIVATKATHWVPFIAYDTLSRRLLGLNWNVRLKSFWSNEFELWPVPNLRVSDARLYRVAEMLRQDPWVKSVSPVYEDPDFQITSENEGVLPTDDPFWYLGPLGINVYEAWKMFKPLGKQPGEGVLVGLPDTGYLNHPELFFDDGSTRLRLDLQRNFSEPLNLFNALDFCNTLCGLTFNKTYKLAYSGHGTTVASLIISPPGKQQGTIGNYHTEGAAPFSEVIPMRIGPSVLLTDTVTRNLALAINYATDMGAKVISISMGGASNKDEELKQAVKDATARGVIIAAAAGNGPYGVNLPQFYLVAKPASYPETIAVCGSNAYERAWKDSSNGPLVDICAPAEDIRRARAGWVSLIDHVNDTDQSEGTSMSTALTASVAALWLSYHGYDELLQHYNNVPADIPRAFRHILKTEGHRKPEGWNSERFGAGIIDAARVLRAPLPDFDQPRPS